jgi:hypothetical protein
MRELVRCDVPGPSTGAAGRPNRKTVNSQQTPNQGACRVHDPPPRDDHRDARVVAGLTDFGPGRSKLFPNSADEYIKVHDHGADHADVTERSGGVWERLHYDRSDPDRVVMTTTDSNLWGGRSGHTYTFTRRPNGTTAVDAVVVREGKNFKGRMLGFVLGTIGKGKLKSSTTNRQGYRGLERGDEDDGVQLVARSDRRSTGTRRPRRGRRVLKAISENAQLGPIWRRVDPESAGRLHALRPRRQRNDQLRHQPGASGRTRDFHERD